MKVEKNQGEIKVTFEECPEGNISLAEMGLTDDDLNFESGHVRLLFDFSETNGNRNYYDTPTVKIEYHELMAETLWQCDFNNETILDKTDHHGHSTIMLLKRKELVKLEHHHENSLIVHGDFPQGVHLKSKDSIVHFFK